MDSQQPEYSAFISYATADKVKAEEICACLEARGLRCWIAPRDVRAGREYGNEIIDAIERAPLLVLVLSSAANDSKFVRREVERAVAKGDPVITVRIENVMPSTALELFVSATHWIDVWSGDFVAHMDRLVRDLAERPSLAAAESSAVARAGAIDKGSGNARRVRSRAAAVVLLAAVAGAAYQYGARQGGTAAPVPASAADPPASSKDPAANATPSPTLPGPEEVPPLPAPTGVPQADPRPQAGAPSVPVAPRDASPPPVQQVAEPEGLEELRQQASALTIRAGVVDQSLNRLAEQMRPNGLRGDVLARQQSVAGWLASGQRALDRRDVAAATKYFDMARSDVEALERFLGR